MHRGQSDYLGQRPPARFGAILLRPEGGGGGEHKTQVTPSEEEALCIFLSRPYRTQTSRSRPCHTARRFLISSTTRRHGQQGLDLHGGPLGCIKPGIPQKDGLSGNLWLGSQTDLGSAASLLGSLLLLPVCF